MGAPAHTDSAALFAALRRISAGATRARRAGEYLRGAFAIGGADRAAVVWRRRRMLVCVEAATATDFTRREFPRTAEAYEHYAETAGRWPEGPIAAAALAEGWAPPALARGAPCRLLLPEGRSIVAPRLFVQGGEPASLLEYDIALRAARPHWVERRRLRRLASIDYLTGAYNFPHLLRVLRYVCRAARRTGESFGVLMLDVDHLGEYNNHHGHLMGSRLLAQLGRALRSAVRADDYVAKYGGDEFMIVLRGARKPDAVESALRLKQRVQRQAYPGLASGELTCCIGVAACPDDGTQLRDLIGAADRATFTAKAMGRNAVVAAGHEKSGDSLPPPR
jgi:diguanylate cyclase (GGDEF)-like protein